MEKSGQMEAGKVIFSNVRVIHMGCLREQIWPNSYDSLQTLMLLLSPDSDGMHIFVQKIRKQQLETQRNPIK